MVDLRLIAFSAGSTLALGAVGLLGPPGAALALLALPLPTLVVGGIGGTASASAATAGAAGALGGLLGGSVGLAFLAVAGVPAVLSVRLLRRAWRLEAVVAGAMTATVLGTVALAAWHEPGVAAWRAQLADAWRASFDSSLALYRDLGMAGEELAELEAARTEIGDRIGALLPALIGITVTGWWLLNLGLSRRWAGWLQLQSLSRWRAAEWMIWVLIASGFAAFLLPGGIGWLATNLLVAALACYFAQGLAIVSYFLQRVGLPRPLRMATFAVIAMQYLAALLVVALGVFDFWGDFRKLSARPADATAGTDSE